MSEVEQAQPIVATAVRKRWGYSWWMVGVVVVFMVCEVFLFVWGYGAAGSDDGLFRNDACFYAWGGLLGTLWFLEISFSKRSCFLRIGVGSCFLLGVFLLINFGIWSRAGIRDWARTSACNHRLRQLGTALENYHEKYGRFPPAFVVDESGRAMHSWRTLLLPFMELEDLYAKYDLAQPWDSAENHKLGEIPVDVFVCPSFWWLDETKNHASYVAVVGNDTFWSADGISRSMSEISDPSRVPVLIEMNHTGIPWHEPRDVELDDLVSGKVSWQKNVLHYIPAACCRRSVFYEMENGFYHVLFADRSVRRVPCDCTGEELRCLFSIGEKPDSEFQSLGIATDRRPRVFREAIFWVWCMSLFVQFGYAVTRQG